MRASVVVATFGERAWVELALSRAVPSAEAQAETIFVHGDTLHGARNLGLGLVTTDTVIFLDADDEIEPGYIDAMSRATADLRAPSVRYVVDGHAFRPKMPRVAGHGHDCDASCLAYGNWLVIGTACPTDLLRRVGGFRDFAIYEDYDAWVRCWQAGASIEAVPEAIYRAHVRHDSRNRGPDRAVKHATHQAIARANGLEVPA